MFPNPLRASQRRITSIIQPHTTAFRNLSQSQRNIQHKVTPSQHNNNFFPTPSTSLLNNNNHNNNGLTSNILQSNVNNNKSRYYNNILRLAGGTSGILFSGVPIFRHKGEPDVKAFEDKLRENLDMHWGDEEEKVPQLFPNLTDRMLITPTVEEFAEADKLQKLAQIKRRAILEQEILAQYKAGLSYVQRKTLEEEEEKFRKNKEELYEQMGVLGSNQDNKLLVTSPTLKDLATTQVDQELDKVFGMDSESAFERDVLTKEEQQALTDWRVQQQIDSIVINHFVTDLGHYIRSFCTTYYQEIVDDFFLDFPKIIIHYLVSPHILNYVYDRIPFWPYLPHQRQGLTIFEWASTLNPLLYPLRWVPFDSGHYLVDWRCFRIASNLIWKTTTFLGLVLYERYPWLFQAVGGYALYPAAWALYRLAPRGVLANVIQVSNEEEQKWKTRQINKERQQYVERRERRQMDQLLRQKQALEELQAKRKAERGEDWSLNSIYNSVLNTVTGNNNNNNNTQTGQPHTQFGAFAPREIADAVRVPKITPESLAELAKQHEDREVDKVVDYELRKQILQTQKQIRASDEDLSLAGAWGPKL